MLPYLTSFSFTQDFQESMNFTLFPILLLKIKNRLIINVLKSHENPLNYSLTCEDKFLNEFRNFYYKLVNKLI